MRTFGKAVLLAAASLGLYLALLALSARVPALPTAHHQEWVSQLKQPTAGRTHLDLIYSATQWYERAILFAITAAVIAFAARFLVSRQVISIGTLLWLGLMIAVGWPPDVVDLVALLLAGIGSYAGIAMAEDVRDYFGSQSMSPTGRV
jgi:hypothetical protein